MLAVPLMVVASRAAAQTEMYDGRPAFAEGVDLGYYLWRDGDTWRLRWTTKGRMRAFAGSVVAQSGKLKSLKRIDVESERRVIYPGKKLLVVVGPRGRSRVVGGRGEAVVQNSDKGRVAHDGDNRIVFAARTDDDVDGFDFKTDDVDELRFVLNIDGRPAGNLTEVGAHNHRPGSLPLIVRLK